MNRAAPRLSIGIVLMPRFTLCAFANFVDVLRLAADEADRSRPILCRWSVIAPDLAPVRSSCGVTVQPDTRPAAAGSFDYVVVVGGLIGEVAPPEAWLRAFLGQAARAGVPLAGICTGAFVLHRAGLMDGYRCCVSWFHREDWLEEFEGLEPVTDQIFVADRDRLTCSGGVNAAHFAAWLVSRHLGPAAARKSLNIMQIEGPLSGERPQAGTPLSLHSDDELVRRALGLMRETMETPLGADRLAERLGVGRRQLERRFAAGLGMSPQRAGRALRLHEAKRMLSDRANTVTEVAAATGFCDVSHLVRAFRASEGTTPQAWRELSAPSRG